MNDLAQNLDTAERTYALDPTAASWKAVTEARAALERDKTRQDALSRIAADEERAKLEAHRATLRNEVSELLSVLTVQRFFADLESDRADIRAARASLEKAHASIALQSELGEQLVRTGDNVSDQTAHALACFEAPAVGPLGRALLADVRESEVATALGIGQSGGVDVQLWAHGDTGVLTRAAIHDRLTGSKKLAPMVEELEEQRAARHAAFAIRQAAILEGKRDVNNGEEQLKALADRAEARARGEASDTITETN
jgi:hypothetical protein